MMVMSIAWRGHSVGSDLAERVDMYCIQYNVHFRNVCFNLAIPIYRKGTCLRMMKAE